MGFCRTLATGALAGWPNQINGKSMLFFGTDVVDQLLLGCEAFVLDYGGVGGCLSVATDGVDRALGIDVYADDLCGCCAGVVDEPDGVAVGEFGDDFHVVYCLLVDVMLCGCVCGGEPVVAVEAECCDRGTGGYMGEPVGVADGAVGVGGCADDGEYADGEECGGDVSPHACGQCHVMGFCWVLYSVAGAGVEPAVSASLRCILLDNAIRPPIARFRFDTPRQ